ncbi:MAG: YetF domain-containing protein [Chloroflexia bacterium]
MDILIRGTVVLWALYLIVRLLGKRELAQLTPFELIVLVAVGDLIQQGVTHNDFSMTGAILAVVVFAFWASLLSWAIYLSPRLERLVDGTPEVIIRDGEWIHANLRRSRMTIAEAESEIRLAGIARVADVAWGVIEPQGRLSFIQRGRRTAGRGADEARTVS